MRFQKQNIISFGLIVAIVCSLAPGIFAQDSLTFPYTGEITSQNVYVRSGPGVNYYPCGKLNIGNKVKVVAHTFSWSQILPPQGCFSWISTQYVQLDAAGDTGTVTGDQVRVFAGSNQVSPNNSTRMQIKLNKGDKVRLFSKDTLDGYYKIVPPQGAYLYINTEFVKCIEVIAPAPVAPALVAPAAKPADANTPAASAATAPAKPADANAPAKPAAFAVSTPALDAKMQQYRDLEKQIAAEKAKPAAERNYTEIKKALTELASHPEYGKASRYSIYALKQINRHELAMNIQSTLAQQQQETDKVKAGIEEFNQAKLAEVKDFSKYAVVGKLQFSNMLGHEPCQNFWRVVDISGKLICYASSDGSMTQNDVDQFVGKKVGLIGSIGTYVPTGGALVTFSKIDLMQ